MRKNKMRILSFLLSVAMLVSSQALGVLAAPAEALPDMTAITVEQSEEEAVGLEEISAEEGLPAEEVTDEESPAENPAEDEIADTKDPEADSSDEELPEENSETESSNPESSDAEDSDTENSEENTEEDSDEILDEELAEEEMTAEEAELLEGEELLQAGATVTGKISVVQSNSGNQPVSYENEAIYEFFESLKTESNTTWEITLLSDLTYSEALEISTQADLVLHLNNHKIKIENYKSLRILNASSLHMDGGTVEAHEFLATDIPNVELSGCKITAQISAVALMRVKNVDIIGCELNGTHALEFLQQADGSIRIIDTKAKTTEHAIKLGTVKAFSMENSSIEAEGTFAAFYGPQVTEEAIITNSTLQGYFGITLDDCPNMTIEDSTVKAAYLGMEFSDCNLNLRNAVVEVTNPVEVANLTAIMMRGGVLNVADSQIRVKQQSGSLTDVIGIKLGAEDNTTVVMDRSGIVVEVSKAELTTGISAKNSKNKKDVLELKNSEISVKHGKTSVGQTFIGGIRAVNKVTLSDSKIAVNNQAGMNECAAGILPENGSCELYNSVIEVDSKYGGFALGTFYGSKYTMHEGTVLSGLSNAKAFDTDGPINITNLESFIFQDEDNRMAIDSQLKTYKYLRVREIVVINADIEKRPGTFYLDAVIDVPDCAFGPLTWQKSGKIHWYGEDGRELNDQNTDDTSLNTNTISPLLPAGPTTIRMECDVNVYDSGSSLVSSQRVSVERQIVIDPIVEFRAKTIDEQYTGAFSNGRSSLVKRAVYGEGVEMPETPICTDSDMRFYQWVTEDGTPFTGAEDLLTNLRVYAQYVPVENVFYPLILEVTDTDLQVIPDNNCKLELDKINYRYTGKAITPIGTDYQVIFDGKELKNGVDYTVRYKDNTNVGSAVAAINGKGNFYFSYTAAFEIKPADITGDTELKGTLVYEYTGKKIKPAVKLVRQPNGYVLREGKDYKITFYHADDPGMACDLLEAGKYNVELEGLGSNFEGISSKFDAIEVVYGKSDLKSATVKISGPIGKGQTYSIDNADMGIIECNGEPAAVEGPDLDIVVNGKHLSYGDYEMYVNNKPYTEKASAYRTPGKYTISLRGIGKYKGELKLTYKTTAADLSALLDGKYESNDRNQLKLTLQDRVLLSTNGATPVLTIENMKNGYTLVNGLDYTLSYKNNKKPGTATVTIKGKGAYKGTVNRTYQVQTKELTSKDIYMSAADLMYNGKAGNFATKVALYDKGKKLVAGKDYEKTMQYFGPDGKLLSKKATLKNGDLVYVQVKGKGNYSGTRRMPYKVTQALINKAKARMESYVVYEYSVRAFYMTPEFAKWIQITMPNGVELEYGTDYVPIDYKNNTKAGNATVTIKGVGNYAGTMQFKVPIVKWCPYK